MVINVVTVNSGWILQKISERIVSEGNKLDHNFIISNTCRNDVDCNLYVDIQNCYHSKSNTLDIGLFTHADKDNINTVNMNCVSLDYIIHMTKRYYEMFGSIYPKDKMSVLYPSEVNTVFTQYKPKIGIFQRGGYVGKGHNFVNALMHQDIVKDFKFKFIGKGWEGIINTMLNKGIECEYINSEQYSEYEKHYHDVDYVLIPSLWEGGPMGILEGLSCGKPIISSNVGFVNYDFKVDYVYEPNDVHGLVRILESIKKPIEDRRSSVSKVTYEVFTKGLIDIINKIKK
jgi:glycosyltransferase involved in cell wall biosynthesis